MNKILNIDEVAQLLRISVWTVYKLIKFDNLPAFKASNKWRFRQDHLMERIDRKMRESHLPR